MLKVFPEIPRKRAPVKDAVPSAPLKSPSVTPVTCENDEMKNVGGKLLIEAASETLNYT